MSTNLDNIRMTLNGVPAELNWQPKAEPGEECTEVASWDKESLKIYGVEPQDINTVEIPIDVYNEAEWGVSNRDDPVDDEFVIYPKGVENATEPKHEIQPTDIVLFDNDACSMVICGFYSDPVFGYTAKVYYENKTDERVSVHFGDGAINGVETVTNGFTTINPNSNLYEDIYWEEYMDTYKENGSDLSSISEILMTVKIAQYSSPNTVYEENTYLINPQTNSVTTSE